MEVEHPEGPGQDDQGEDHRDPDNDAKDVEALLVGLLLLLGPVEVDVPVAEDAAASSKVGGSVDVVLVVVELVVVSFVVATCISKSFR